MRTFDLTAACAREDSSPSVCTRPPIHSDAMNATTTLIDASAFLMPGRRPVVTIGR